MAVLIFFVAILLNTTEVRAATYFGNALCAYPQYQCIKVKRWQSWEKLFPDPIQRDLVQRLNRSDNRLWSGKKIIVPKNLENVSLFDLSPLPLQIVSDGKKQIIIDQDKLAWAAYDAYGYLVRWGPISSGRDVCVDSEDSCRTITGIFHIYWKKDKECDSELYDGAPMPYCMFFHKGFALHGSNDIPGNRASHGCVRMFTKDAKWLNTEFIELANEEKNIAGTKVIILPLSSDSIFTTQKRKH